MLKKLIAHIALCIWPTEWALRVTGQHPEKDFNKGRY